MNYKIEDLIPIVGTLVKKYTAYESTSVTYEQAERLMEAVVYCIREAKRYGDSSILPAAGIPAQKAYEIGFACVEEKTRRALKLYDEILPEFCHYGNRCLYNTFVNELPEFFARYDIRFAPQDTILTLDYPVLRDLSAYTGIDRIYEFIQCVDLEQRFLNLFPRDYVTHMLSKNSGQYDEMTDNVCEYVLLTLFVHVLAGKSLAKPDLEDRDYSRIQEITAKTDLDMLSRQLTDMVEQFTSQCGGYEQALSEYLAGAVHAIAFRLKHTGIRPEYGKNK